MPVLRNMVLTGSAVREETAAGSRGGREGEAGEGDITVSDGWEGEEEATTSQSE